MKCIYTHETTVLPSLCDFDGRLSVPDTFAQFMDIATAHAEVLGIGMNDLVPRGLFWLTVRTKARFYRRPGMTESVTIRTWPETPERSRCNRDYTVEKDGEVLIEGRTEWMIMNMRTHRLTPTDDVFPKDLDIDERRVLNEPFLRLPEDFAGAEDIGDYTVRATDIDLGGHMNNAAYIRALAGAFTSKDWRALNVRELEATYRSPCFEGETLRIQRKKDGDGSHLFRFAREDQTIFLAKITPDVTIRFGR